MERLDTPVSYQPAAIEFWLEDQIKEKRHKRVAARVHPLFFRWGAPRLKGFRAASYGVSSGKLNSSDLDADREAAVAYVLSNYQMGPIMSLIFWAAVKAVITKLVFMLFDLCVRDPDALVVYYGTQEEPDASYGHATPT